MSTPGMAGSTEDGAKVDGMMTGLGVGRPPSSEAGDIERILDATRSTLFDEYQRGVRPVRRDAHAKSHGCVQAEFTVLDDVPPELRVGLFAEPRTYPAWIRFSNGLFFSAPDFLPNIRGVAVKLMGLAGTKLPVGATQDFLLSNHNAAFVRNASDYVDFSRRAARGSSGIPAMGMALFGFYFGLFPPHLRLRELYNVLSPTMRRAPSPLAIRYWSQTPYMLGTEQVARYSLLPTTPEVASAPFFSRNRLREALVGQLEREQRGAAFDFAIQLRTDPARMPVEDAAVPWCERTAPFRRVATLTIPPQIFDTEERRNFDENLSFTPWHCLSDHTPVGGINRVRKAVYDAMSELRHQMNDARREEPRP